MQNIIPKPSFLDWVKHPLTASLLLMASLVLIFVSLYYRTNDKRVNDCLTEKQNLEIKNDTLLSRYYEVVSENNALREINTEQSEIYDSIGIIKAQNLIKKIENEKRKKAN